MTTIAVVYHSGFGHTEVIAKAVARGALANLIKVEDADKYWDMLEESDALIFGCPTYMGSASAPFKAFMDSTSKIWLEQKWKDKIAAGFTNSWGLSGDKLSTLIQLAIFAAQHSMIWVGADVMPGHPEGLDRMNSFLGLMAQSENAPPDQSPPPEDIKTAEMFGERVKSITEKFKRGT